MKRCKINSKQGFTIIEVVLVLAIAGLIFLMVFLALPALQRSQRDTQRRDQLSMLMTQLTQYQANNRNRLPKCGGNKTEEINTETGDESESVGLTNSGLLATTSLDWLLAENDETPAPAGGGDSGNGCAVTAEYKSDGDGVEVSGGAEWIKFYKNYLMAQGDTFEDPLGQPYSFEIVTCPKGGECEQRTDTSFDDQNYKILLTYGSTCDGETVISNSGARRISVAYKLEGGGTYCSNN